MIHPAGRKDADDLFRRFARAVDHFACALSVPALQIDRRVAELGAFRPVEACERLLDGDKPVRGKDRLADAEGAPQRF